MVTMLNSFIIPNDTVNNMKTKIEETKEKKIELGFGLCKIGRSNIIRPGGDCTGTECALTEPRKCGIGYYIGGYHTHPRTGTKPSISDMAVAYDQGIECIGSVRENDIKCIVRKGITVPSARAEINSALKNIEEVLPPIVTKEELQRWENVREGLINKYFNTIDVK